MEHFPVSMEVSEGTYALYASRVPSTGIIFVHGFDGSPRTTWVNFEGLIEQISSQGKQWNDCDLFFYSYKSYDQIPVLAEAFQKFLVSVAATKAADIVAASDQFARTLGGGFTLGIPLDLLSYRGEAPYKNLILVGHSTGAVIIREALRVRVSNIIKENANLSAWMKNKKKEDEGDLLIVNSHLRLFAPAHLGVLAAGKLGAVLNLPVTNIVVGCYLGSNPLYQNLRHDSPTILDLRKDTEQLYVQHKLEALRACSLFGEHEEVVYVGGYKHDEPSQTQSGHDHRSVCKPNHGYTKPLDFVMDVTSIAKHA
jgi:hypothetical protein